MNVSIAKNAIEAAFLKEDFDELEIDFFGGEPMLEFELMTEICHWLWSRPWPKPYICFAITNGTLVHGKVADWVEANKERIILCLSLDGTEEMHNLNRGNSYKKIDIDLFKRLWPKQTVKMTISPLTVYRMAEGIIHIHQLGFDLISTYAFGADWSSSHEGVFAQQLNKLADFYIAHPEIKPCNIVSMEIQYIFQPREKRNYCGAGVSMSCVDGLGREYPCQTFLPMSTGRLQEETTKAALRLLETENAASALCQDCTLLPICQTCYGINFSLYGDPFVRSDMNCRFTKLRARATAYMLGNMIVNRDRKYTFLEEIDDSQMYHIIKAVCKISGSDGLVRASLGG